MTGCHIQKDRQHDTSKALSISSTELTFHKGRSQESCVLAGCARPYTTGRQPDCLCCHSFGREHGSRAEADLRWSQNKPLWDSNQAELVLSTSHLRLLKAAELGCCAERQNKRKAFISNVSSSVDFLQITGSDYIPPCWPCATPFSQQGAPG